MSYSCHEQHCCLLPPQKSNKTSFLMNSTAKTKNYSTISTSRKIKNILKPVLGKIFKSKQQKQKKSNTYKSSSSPSSSSNYEDYYDEFGWWKSEKLQNEANEELEDRLIEEIQNSPDDAAIFIFNDSSTGSKNLRPINKEKFYIPVHFARTNAGTFFWTSVQKPMDPFKIEWHFLDRWAQA